MEQKPWLAKVLTVALLFVPVMACVLVFLATQKKGLHVTLLLGLELFVLSTMSLLTAFGVWRVRPWGFILLLTLVMSLLGSDIYHIMRNPTHQGLWAFIDVSVVAIGIACLLQRHIAAPYFNPKIRWWERAPRHKVHLDAKILVGGKAISIQILDVSETGCFLSTDAPLSPGETVEIDLTYKEYKFESATKVIRASQNPKGIGLMFVNPNKYNKREIQRIIKDLKRNIGKVKDRHPLVA